MKYSNNNNNNKSAQSNLGRGSRRSAVAHVCRKSPLVTMMHPKFAPESTRSHIPIPKPHYLPHPWTRLTHDAKQHPADRPMHVRTD